jgi:spermidine/putrescine transport system ATP-binding protein
VSDAVATERAAALSLQGLEKRYGDVTALKPLSIDIPAGTFLSVLGPSGSGKTTVLRLIGGFTEPSGGRILLGGQDITALPIFSRPCNTVFQDYALFPHLSVRQNVAYGLSVRGRPKTEIASKVEEILAIVGLERMGERAPAQLSGGQRQRVALARALICEPRLMLLDEPLAALDAELRRQMQDFLKAQQRRSGITFLFVTHDQQEAIGISDLILVMQKGGVEQVATPRELYYRPRTQFVAGFFGENNLIPGRILDGAGSVARIETPVGIFAAANPHGCKAGSAAIIALRPEAIAVQHNQSTSEQNDRQIHADIADISFSGSMTRLQLRAGPLLITTVLPSEQVDTRYQLGERVHLGWSPDSAVLVEASS